MGRLQRPTNASYRSPLDHRSTGALMLTLLLSATGCGPHPLCGPGARRSWAARRPRAATYRAATYRRVHDTRAGAGRARDELRVALMQTRHQPRVSMGILVR